MQSVLSHQAARLIFLILQSTILVAFVGAVFLSVGSAAPWDPPFGAAGAAPEKEPQGDEAAKCIRGKTWLILPFAFLTGGLMNLDGFTSTAVLLL